jgi:hypothetical protein
LWEIRQHLVLAVDIQHVIEPPIDDPDSFGRMEESLKNVLLENASSKRDSKSFDSLIDSIDDMRRSLKYIRPDEVEQVDKGIFTTQSLHSQSQMLHSRSSCLSMNKVSISKSIF